MEGESMFAEKSAYWVNGREIAHFEGNDLIELRLTKAVIKERRTEFKADPRVELRPSGADWLTIRLKSPEDADFVLELARLAEEAHRSLPGVLAKPPPTGVELERRRRFH
jgi:hypothetical protein